VRGRSRGAASAARLPTATIAHERDRTWQDALSLVEQLVGAVDLREAADPDDPPWIADREIRRLERELWMCLRTWSTPQGSDVDHEAKARATIGRTG
jgi:hypothetical protein